MDQVKPHILFTPYVLAQYIPELEAEIVGLMANETERSQFRPLFQSVNIFNQRTTAATTIATSTRIDLHIYEIVDNKPVHRIYCYTISLKGYVSWDDFVDGQRLYFPAFKNWLEYIRITHSAKIRARERSYFN